MNKEQLDAIREAFLVTMDTVYNDSCRHGFDDGDSMSWIGHVREAEDLTELCENFRAWVDQIYMNNEG